MARSAKAALALGATLIAMLLPISGFAANQAQSVVGISGGDTLGISGGDAFGISGGDVTGISGGDILGISGGDLTGISGGDVLGISGGDLTGISGGDILGISGGDLTGISGGDVLGISGGDLTGISGGDILGISGGDAPAMVLAGPVDSIDRGNGVFESLGQFVMASQDMLASLRVGDYVSVEGSIVSSGWLYADTLTVSGERYVPGSSEVFVTGMLSSIDLSSGTARMGRLTIDYTPSLSGGALPAGDLWAFQGIRPSTNGVMVSDRTFVSTW